MLGITYPVLLDPDQRMAASYDVVGVPRTYLVDRKGIIRYKILGSASSETLKKQVSQFAVNVTLPSGFHREAGKQYRPAGNGGKQEIAED